MLEPTGPHSPISNLALGEAAVEEEMLSDPESGSAEGVAEPADGGTENLPAARMELHSFTEMAATISAPDTSRLLDVGAASFGAPNQFLETVHGIDNRRRVTTTASYPYRAIASLLITGRDGTQWIGTGWFISPRTLITAGHCVYIKNSGVAGRDGWVKTIEVMPGRDGSRLPFGSVTSSQFWSVRGWGDNGDENYDYGAIVLPTPMGNVVGTFGFGAFNDGTLRGAVVNVTGYPGDKPSGTCWHDSKTVASVSPTKVHYDIDTAGGQSGAPVYMIRNGKRYAVAVHAYGGAVTNSGTRISAQAYQNLVNWRA